MKRYSLPAYPTRAILDAHPELLRVLPARWQRNTVVLAALATAGTLIAGRWNQAQGAEPMSRVSPIFVHGEGRGAFGCEAVNPPVFLSEDEARQVVVEEGRRNGITFTIPGPELAQIELPLTNESNWNEKTKTQTGKLALDGWDAGRKIGFEFVSGDDFKAWEGKDGGPRSTVESFNVIGAATVLRDGLATAKPAGALAVFYDPCVGPNDVFANQSDNAKPRDWTAAQADAKMIARYALRQQVRDFIKWLKAEGVI